MTEHKNPWTLKSKEIVYDNNWIRVEHHDVLNPSQKPGIYGKIHFKNIAIGIIPVDQEGYSWLVGQYRYPLDEYSWEIPEGGGKVGTQPIVTAKRELLEETGIVAQKWTHIQKIHTSNSVSDEYAMIYLAEELSFEKAQPDEDEELMVKKIHLKDLYQMVLAGEITDSLSVAGIFKLKALLPQHFS